jgi:hypothetical protein
LWLGVKTIATTLLNTLLKILLATS